MIRRRAPLRRLPLKQRRKVAQAPKAKPIARRKRLRFSNAYTHPEVRKMVRRIHRRSKGVCEAQLRCNGNPVQGDPHHLSYAPFKGWKRLLVDDDQLIDCCRPCHLEFERRKQDGEAIGPSFLDDDA